MNRNDLLFNENYKIDDTNNCYMIEVALDQYADIFNEWDPAPFKRRDIDPDLEIYLEGSSEDVPLKHPVELFFTIPAGAYSKRLEAEARDGLANSFAFKLYLIKKQLKKTNELIGRSAILGFTLLWVGALLLKQFGDENVFLTLLIDAAVIGGWVFLWEAVYLFFYTNREIFYRYRLYKRLQQAPVVFQKVENANYPADPANHDLN